MNPLAPGQLKKAVDLTLNLPGPATAGNSVQVAVALPRAGATPLEQATALLQSLGFTDAKIKEYDARYGGDLRQSLTTELAKTSVSRNDMPATPDRRPDRLSNPSRRNSASSTINPSSGATYTEEINVDAATYKHLTEFAAANLRSHDAASASSNQLQSQIQSSSRSSLQNHNPIRNSNVTGNQNQAQSQNQSLSLTEEIARRLGLNGSAQQGAMLAAQVSRAQTGITPEAGALLDASDNDEQSNAATENRAVRYVAVAPEEAAEMKRELDARMLVARQPSGQSAASTFALDVTSASARGTASNPSGEETAPPPYGAAPYNLNANVKKNSPVFVYVDHARLTTLPLLEAIKARLEAAGLPVSDHQINFVPPKSYYPIEPLPRGAQGGYVDCFGNEWIWNPVSVEWDIQLSRTGRARLA